MQRRYCFRQGIQRQSVEVHGNGRIEVVVHVGPRLSQVFRVLFVVNPGLEDRGLSTADFGPACCSV